MIEQQAPEYFSDLHAESGQNLLAVEFNVPALNRHYLLLVINHLVVDGVSWWILLSDLEKLYERAHTAIPTTLPGKTTSVQQWAHALENHAIRMREKGADQFWMRQYPVNAGLFGATKTDKLQSAALATFKVALSEQGTAALTQDVPAAFGVQVPEVIMTALLQSLEAWCGNEQLLVDVEGHGREDPMGGYNLLRSVGWFTSVYPLLFDLHGSSGLGVRLRTVKERMRGVPLRGMEYGVLRYLHPEADTRQLLAAQPAADVLFNYMGQWEKSLASSSRFSFARPIQAWKGGVVSPKYQLEINSIVFDGRLEVEWTYIPELLEVSKVERLATDFLRYLEELIQFCISTEESSLTPSDFPSARLSQDDLDDLLAEFGE